MILKHHFNRHNRMKTIKKFQYLSYQSVTFSFLLHKKTQPAAETRPTINFIQTPENNIRSEKGIRTIDEQNNSDPKHT